MSSGAVSEAVSHIEAELSAFWSHAQDESGVTKARAATMNYVAVVAPSEASGLRAQVEELAQTRAGRVFVVVVDGRLAPWELAHDVGAVCNKEGDVVVCYDRVELTFGVMAAARAASVLGALGLSEVPTILEVGPGAPGVLVDPLLRVANRVIVDSAHTGLGRIAEIVRKARAPVADRAFVRAFSWRELVARFFDEAPSAAQEIRSVTIERTTGTKNDPAALLVGWLASRLGWKLESATRAIDGRGEPIALELVEHGASDHTPPGELVAIRIGASVAGAPLALACARAPGDRTVRWTMTGAKTEAHEHSLGFRDEGWVLIKALDGTEGDKAYREAVLAAAAWSAR